MRLYVRFHTTPKVHRCSDKQWSRLRAMLRSPAITEEGSTVVRAILKFEASNSVVTSFQRSRYTGDHVLVSYWSARLCARTNVYWRFILPYGRANGNWLAVVDFPPASYVVRNFGKPTALVVICFQTCFSETSVDFQRTAEHRTFQVQQNCDFLVNWANSPSK